MPECQTPDHWPIQSIQNQGSRFGLRPKPKKPTLKPTQIDGVTNSWTRQTVACAPAIRLSACGARRADASLMRASSNAACLKRIYEVSQHGGPQNGWHFTGNQMDSNHLSRPLFGQAPNMGGFFLVSFQNTLASARAAVGCWLLPVLCWLL